MVNVELSDAPCSAKRGGSDVQSTNGGTAFSQGIRAAFRWVPAGDETLAEHWLVDGAGVVKRNAGGGWVDVVLDDPITGSKSEVAFVGLNGKLFILYKSGVNRAHCWDPGLVVPVVRRVGLRVSGAPTVADTGAGAYGATLRYYRTRSIQLDLTGTVLIRRSEPSASAAFTPSGGGLAARVTRAAVINERETHWELEASADNFQWIVLYGFGVSSVGAAIPIATTFQDDTSAVSAYGTRPVSDLAGTYTLFPSAKFGTTDGNRLILAGSYELASESHESRIWISETLGVDKGDDERWVNTSTRKSRIDLSEKNGGAITGLTPTISGVFWAGKYRRIIRLTPTDDLFKPYLTREISSRIGFLNHWSVVECEDSAGSPAVAFISFQGIHRLGSGGLEYCGRDVEDIWRGLFTYTAAGKVNLGATITPGFGSYYSDKRQLWFWVATGVNDFPNVRLRWDVRQAIRKDRYGVRGGWVVDTGNVGAYCAAQFADIALGTMTRVLKPHTGTSDTLLLKHDTTTQTDNGTAFQAYGKTRSLTPSEILDHLSKVQEPIVVGLAQASSTIRVTIIADFDLTTAYADLMLDPRENESRVIRKLDGLNLDDITSVQLQFGDAGAIASKWAIDAIILPNVLEGAK